MFEASFPKCQVTANAARLLTSAEVIEVTRLSRATIYRMVVAGEFPAPVQLSPNRVTWLNSDVEACFNSRPRAHGLLTQARERHRG